MKERQLLEIVSGRIRDRRRDQRLSLDRLATLAGVSKGMLVQIESGQANPSIATLCKVAAALGASVADLVQVAGQHPAEVMPASAPRLLWRGRRAPATLLVDPRTGHARVPALGAESGDAGTTRPPIHRGRRNCCTSCAAGSRWHLARSAT